jgi:hypothetical protein
MHICIYVCMCVYTYIYTYVYLYIYVYISCSDIAQVNQTIYIYIYMYIYMHMCTERSHTHKHTHTHTHIRKHTYVLTNTRTCSLSTSDKYMVHFMRYENNSQWRFNTHTLRRVQSVDESSLVNLSQYAKSAQQKLSWSRHSLRVYHKLRLIHQCYKTSIVTILYMVNLNLEIVT